VADLLRPFVAAVAVGNPLQITTIAQAKVKIDKIDAEALAHLLQCENLPAGRTPRRRIVAERTSTSPSGGRAVPAMAIRLQRHGGARRLSVHLSGLQLHQRRGRAACPSYVYITP
jgi:hypothetical protein